MTVILLVLLSPKVCNSYLSQSLGETSSTLMPVIAVLRIAAVGNRIIRKFLRQEVHTYAYMCI